MILTERLGVMMNDVLEYIHNNIRTPLHIEDIATRFGYSKWNFCVQFSKFTGQTFLEYVRHYRISLAALDILLGKKVLEVAMEYGYDTAVGFNKAFLREYGCVPTEYRKRAKESRLYYERRKASMFQLSNRCIMLREEVVNRKSFQNKFSFQRGVYYVLGAAEALKKGKNNENFTTAGIVNTLNKFTPVILPKELVVGFNYSDPPRCQAAFYQTIEDTEQNRKEMAENELTPEEIEQYFQIFSNKEIDFDISFKDSLTKEEKEARIDYSADGRCIAENHSVLGYEKILKYGFEGILKEIEHFETENGSNNLYVGVKRICMAACNMGEKYAAKAEELLRNKAEDYDCKDLERIISVCRKVPRYPVQTFLEAVQSLWFAHIINTWEDGVNANSLGRLDQILYPYYQSDIKKGIITKDEAFEIVCCLWLKLYRDYDVQQSCVGGTAADGTSMVNELSYMMLDATEQLDFIRCLSVRYSQNTEREFLKRALEVVGHVQKGVPFFFNDDMMIPALMSQGISLEDACDYTQIGCVETVIPGKSNPHAVSGEANLLKAVEYVLCNGHSMMYPELQPGVATGKISSIKTYQQFYDKILLQIERILDLTCSMIKKDWIVPCYNMPRPYKSLLTEGCLESGKDFNEAGSKYDYYQVMLEGIPNLADSLLVIKKFVYDEKKYTLEQMKAILEDDYPDEAVRAEFMHKAPKFGNDIDEVDTIAVNILNYCCDLLNGFSEKYSLSFHAQPFTFYWMVEHGENSAASPDGRHKGEIIAYSCSPMQGRDFNGLTAVLNSIAKLPAERTPGTISAIVEADPKLFCDVNMDSIVDMLIAASNRGLSNVQFNIIDADTLIEAQKYPDRYNNLAVRVSGFSQKFNLLSPEIQNHIIGRTKHVCL